MQFFHLSTSLVQPQWYVLCRTSLVKVLAPWRRSNPEEMKGRKGTCSWPWYHFVLCGQCRAAINHPFHPQRKSQSWEGQGQRKSCIIEVKKKEKVQNRCIINDYKQCHVKAMINMKDKVHGALLVEEKFKYKKNFQMEVLRKKAFFFFLHFT